jgi:hypothetical protein
MYPGQWCEAESWTIPKGFHRKVSIVLKALTSNEKPVIAI